MPVHVIPVPTGMTTEDAWLEIRVFGRLHGGEVSGEGRGGCWAVVQVDVDGNMVDGFSEDCG